MAVDPSSDFLAKISGVDTPLFLQKTQFYFALSSLLFHIKHTVFIPTMIAQACLLVVQLTCVPSPTRFFFLVTMYIMATVAITFHFF
jgi:hypothetical protein